ncbi:Mss4-like protein [Nemania sp. FL0916]|nr:Mss4-like protein [Nemania sp. FL0916]
MTGNAERDETLVQNGRDAIELVAHCLCRAQRFTALIPRSSLPLEAVYCHCDTCRRLTGAMYTASVPWPDDAAAAVEASSLQRYVVSDAVTTLSCGTCGACMFAETRPANNSSSSVPRYAVRTGTLANIDVPGLVNIARHVGIADTRDGGAVPWFCDANSDSSRPRLWSGQENHYGGLGDELSFETMLEKASGSGLGAGTASTDPVPSNSDAIPVKCHCGGVNLLLRRPNAYFAAMPRSELPWFIDPTNNKSLAGFDACDSCRISSGSDIFHWTFVLLRHLAFPPSSTGPRPTQTQTWTETVASSTSPSLTPFPTSSPSLKMAVIHDPSLVGTLTFYASSPDVQRYFCSRCFASVFYATDSRPELVDLAIGLLHPSKKDGGARLESLLSWDFGGKMVWRDDVLGGWREAFVEDVEKAAERWRVRRGLPKIWRRVLKEEGKA